MAEPSPIVTALVAEINDAVSLIEKRVMQFLDAEPSRQEIGEFYAAFERKPQPSLPSGGWVTRIKTAGGAVGQAFAGLVGFNEGPVVVAPVTIEKKVGTPRKSWDHARIKPVVIEAILKKYRDPESGAITAPYAVLLMDAFDAVSISGWKTTVLKPLGINPDRFCEVGAANTNLILRESGNAAGPAGDDDA